MNRRNASAKVSRLLQLADPAPFAGLAMTHRIGPNPAFIGRLGSELIAGVGGDPDPVGLIVEAAMDRGHSKRDEIAHAKPGGCQPPAAQLLPQRDRVLGQRTIKLPEAPAGRDFRTAWLIIAVFVHIAVEITF